MKPSLCVIAFFPVSVSPHSPLRLASQLMGRMERQMGRSLFQHSCTPAYVEAVRLCTEKQGIPKSACWGFSSTSLTNDCTGPA